MKKVTSMLSEAYSISAVTLSWPLAFLLFKLENAIRTSWSVTGTFSSLNKVSSPSLSLTGNSVWDSDVRKMVWKCCDHCSVDILSLILLWRFPRLDLISPQNTFESLIEVCNFWAFSHLNAAFFSFNQSSVLFTCLHIRQSFLVSAGTILLWRLFPKCFQ